MKKNYKKPSMLAVTLQHQTVLAASATTGGGAFDGGIGEGDDSGANVKGSKNVWDEEW